VRGLEVSPGSLSKDLRVQRQVRYRTPKPGILGLKFLQPFHLIALQTAVFVPPAIIRDLRHANRTDRLRDCPALAA